MSDYTDIPKTLSLEEAFALLDAKVELLQDAALPLEKAFSAYQEGRQLLDFCEKKLDLVDKQVQEMNEQGQISYFGGTEDEAI